MLTSSEKPRVCIVSAQYLPHVGGVENYVASFSEALLKKGLAVTIVTSGAKGLPEYEERGDLEVFRLPTMQLMKGRFPVTYPSLRRRRLIRRIRQRGFGAVIVNCRFYFLSLLAVKLAKRMKTPCWMLDHGSGHLTMSGRLATKLGERFEHWITFREKMYKPRFAAVSEESRKWLRHFGIEAGVILPNAVDPAEFGEMLDNARRDFRREYAIPEGDFVVSFVGRLTKEKGAKELCDAFRAVAERRSDVHLFLAGEGYLRPKLEGAYPRTVLLGSISKHDVVDLDSQSDILCLPSLSEGFSTAILEAAMCGCYPIVTAVGGAVDIIRTPEHGTILENMEPETVAEAILAALDSPERMKKGAELCRREVVGRFTWERTAEAFLKETGLSGFLPPPAGDGEE